MNSVWYMTREPSGRCADGIKSEEAFTFSKLKAKADASLVDVYFACCRVEAANEHAARDRVVDSRISGEDFEL